MFIFLEATDSNDYFEGTTIDNLFEAFESLNEFGNIFVELMKMDYEFGTQMKSLNEDLQAEKPQGFWRSLFNTIKKILNKILDGFKAIGNVFHKIWLALSRRSNESVRTKESYRDRYYFNYDEYRSEMEKEYEYWKEFSSKTYSYSSRTNNDDSDEFWRDFNNKYKRDYNSGNSSQQRARSDLSNAQIKAIKKINTRISNSLAVYKNAKLDSGKASLGDIQRVLSSFDTTNKAIDKELSTTLKGIDIRFEDNKFGELYSEFKNFYDLIKRMVDKGEESYTKDESTNSTKNMKYINYNLISRVASSILESLQYISSNFLSTEALTDVNTFAQLDARTWAYSDEKYENFVTDKEISPADATTNKNIVNSIIEKITLETNNIAKKTQGPKSFTDFEFIFPSNQFDEGKKMLYRDCILKVISAFAATSNNYKKLAESLVKATNETK